MNTFNKYNQKYMGALEEASQWHVLGFGINVSSFPSLGFNSNKDNSQHACLQFSPRHLLGPLEHELSHSCVAWRGMSMATPRRHL